MQLGMSWRTSWEHIGKKAPKEILKMVTLSFIFPQKKILCTCCSPLPLFFLGHQVAKFHDQKKNPFQLQCILLPIFIHQEKCENIQKMDDKDRKFVKGGFTGLGFNVGGGHKTCHAKALDDHVYTFMYLSIMTTFPLSNVCTLALIDTRTTFYLIYLHLS